MDYEEIYSCGISIDFAFPVGFSFEDRNFVLDGRYNIGVTKMVAPNGYTKKTTIDMYVDGLILRGGSVLPLTCMERH